MKNKNFLGRVLVARAIVPFIAINKISKKLKSIIPNEESDIKKDHNHAQGSLLISKYLLNNFFELFDNDNFLASLEVNLIIDY